jgi:co-chaperonin GroES (HSP10)
MEKVTPMGNRIAARLLPPPEKSASGRIWLLTNKDARSVRFAPKRFVVVAPEQGVQDKKTGEWRRTTRLEAGDIVITGMYPGDSVPDYQVDGHPVWFIPVHNLTCQEVVDMPVGVRIAPPTCTITVYNE